MNPILEIELRSGDWDHALPRLRADLPAMGVLWDAVEDALDDSDLQDELVEAVDRAEMAEGSLIMAEGRLIDVRERLENLTSMAETLAKRGKPTAGAVATLAREIGRAADYVRGVTP